MIEEKETNNSYWATTLLALPNIIRDAYLVQIRLYDLAIYLEGFDPKHPAVHSLRRSGCAVEVANECLSNLLERNEKWIEKP